MGVEVDQEKVYEGSMKDDWDMLPAREVDDENDKKPSDWVEDAMMDDPAASKPADWVDEKRIVDKEATKPEVWDDDEDGVWEPPKIDNPAFKGEWIGSRISNPAYKGVWEAKRIPNPDFVDDPELAKYVDIGYVGFDVYQVKGGTIFDNIIITDSASEAAECAKKWKALSEFEKEKKQKVDDDEAAAFEKFWAARAARAAAEEKAKEAEKAVKGESDEPGKETPKEEA